MSLLKRHQDVPTILLFGCDGQVGWELQRSVALLGRLHSLGRLSERNPNGLCGDLSDLKGIASTIQAVKPHIIINAAAYTAVDLAESNESQASLINARAPAVMAEQAQKLGALLVHYSSDYVFDGSGQAQWCEHDAPSPLSVYGRTKWQGDLAVQACDRHLIFRTSWVYGARGGNFAKTMLKLAMEKDQMKVVGDQVGAPTGADLIADVTAHAIRAIESDPACGGLYHLAASGFTSWHGYAQLVLRQAVQNGFLLKVRAEDIESITTAQFPRPAQRPLNSRLNTQQLTQTFGIVMPAWELGIKRLLASFELTSAFRN